MTLRNLTAFTAILTRAQQLVGLLQLTIVVGVIALLAIGAWRSQHRPATSLVDSHSHTKPAPKQSSPTVAATAEATNSPAANTPGTAATAKPATGSTKSSGTLVISPASVVIYKKPDGVNFTIKPNATSGPAITISASDGKAINLPWSASSTGYIMTTTKDPAPYKPSWPMSTDSTYNSIGVHTYTLSASSSTGAKYTGSITVDVRPMPIFSTTATSFVANAVGEELDIQFNNGGAYEFDFSAVSSFMPTLTVSVGGLSCTGSMDTADTSVTCSDGSSDIDLPPGAYPASFTFENQFQRIVISGTINVIS